MRRGDLSTGPAVLIFIVGAVIVLLLVLSIQQGLFQKIPETIFTLIENALGGLSGGTAGGTSG